MSGRQLRVKGKGSPLRWIVVKEVPVQMVLALDGACEVITEKPGGRYPSSSLLPFAMATDTAGKISSIFNSGVQHPIHLFTSEEAI